jgi:pilus assembly protein TadC
MPKTIAKEFERLYKSYNIDFEEAIKFFRERIKNDWAGIFASLLLINHTQGGSIISQLDDLNTEIENDIISRDRTRSKMMGFKVMSLGSLLLTVGAVFANMMISESAKEYYMNPIGQNEILFTLAVAFTVFLSMLVVEKL